MNAVILSAGLDTNGQNERFVQASKKIRALAIGDYDPASVVGRYLAASKRSERLEIRSVHRQIHIYQSMPADIVWTRHNEREIRDLALRADVWHLNNSWRALQFLRLPLRRKPVLLHHHGSLFRSDPAGMLRQAARHGWMQAVSTIDLQAPAPDVLHWLPTAYDLDELAEIRRQALERRTSDTFRIVSCPTNRSLKSTALLEAAVSYLQHEHGAKIELVLVEGRPWAEAIATKATADVLFDQTMFGYGCNAVEAWAMGLPVIAGADDPWVLERMAETFGALPFVQAESDVASIASAIGRLYNAKTLRKKYGTIGRKHAERYHAEAPALARLIDLYVQAIDSHHADVVAGLPPPARFTAKSRQLYVAGRYVSFRPDEPTTIDNPFIANRLRIMAKANPGFGIQEIDPAP